MKVYLLDLGYMEIDYNFIVTNTVIGTRSNPEPKTKWGQIPMLAVLIDHPEGKILYDTGNNFQGMDYWPQAVREVAPFYYKPEQEIRRQLSLCNTKPEDIKTVILSHMHLDHAGNLNMFKNTKVIMHKDELAHALTTVHSTTNTDAHGFYIKQEVDVEVAEYTLVHGDTEIFEGIEVIHLPGHAPGLLALMVRLKNSGNIIFTQDACYTSANFGPPFRFSGIAYDTKMYMQSLYKLADITKKNNATLIFGHDMEQNKKLKHAPEFYD
jgi:glyoxylase-like metal-dependent hydrolase (beta-lactamase superfamily II)